VSHERRFGGVARLYGNAALDIFANAHVAVIGIGGVGTWVAEGFARSGIGNMTLIDLDDICVTNTNRQIHALTNTIGLDKTTVMAERIKAINPDCRVKCIEDFVLPENVADYLGTAAPLPNLSYVVDACDNIPAKAAIIAHCKRHKIPIITIGGAGGQLDPRLVTSGDLAKTIQCPLSAKLRNDLRRRYHFSKNPKRRFGVECVYSTEQLRYPQADGSVCQTKPALDASLKLDCAGGFGASVAVTATFGFVAVSRVLHKLSSAA
jgi:tRNA A37 threonylcarbamoyladenosine dehydratase